MSFEHSSGLTPPNSWEQEETRYTRVNVPDLFPHSQQRGGEVQLEIPEGLDLEQAVAEWQRSGGQVRTFSYGQNAEMRMKTYSLPDWLVRQKDARLVNDVGESTVAA